jgi:hypothetical protein
MMVLKAESVQEPLLPASKSTANTKRLYTCYPSENISIHQNNQLSHQDMRNPLCFRFYYVSAGSTKPGLTFCTLQRLHSKPLVLLVY